MRVRRRSLRRCAAAGTGAPCRPGSAPGARSRPRSPGRRTSAGRSRGSIAICARLSIWNTPTVSPREIIAYVAGSSCGHARHVELDAVVLAQQIEAACGSASARPSPSRSTLNSPRSSTSYLSHWITVRPSIVAGSIGTSVSTGSCPSRKPPGWIDRCRGKSLDLARTSARSCCVHGRLRGRARRARAPPGPGRVEAPPAACPSASSAVCGNAEHLAHVAHRRARAVADDVRDHRRVAPAVALVHPLDDLFAALVLDVEVDVGRLGALAAQEALEEQVHAYRIDRGDAEAVSRPRCWRRCRVPDTGCRSRSAELHDLLHRQEVAAVVEVEDDREARSRSGACTALRHARPRSAAQRPRVPVRAASRPRSCRSADVRSDSGSAASPTKSDSGRRSRACAAPIRRRRRTARASRVWT